MDAEKRQLAGNERAKMFENKLKKMEEQQVEIKQPTTIDEFITEHKRWILRKLYEKRDEEGDVVFVFKDK